MPRIDLLGSDSKRALLQLMKRAGDVSLDEAVEKTGLARTTLREHFAGLERDGFVERSINRQKRGRPSLRYRLSSQGDLLFPSRDGVLVREMIGFLETEGHHTMLERFFEQFWDRRLRQVRARIEASGSTDLEGRLTVLAQVLEEQGFMPEISTGEEGVSVRECNCPFPETVKKTRLPCRLEAQFFESIFEQDATRVTYIPDGHAACTYLFAPEGE